MTSHSNQARGYWRMRLGTQILIGITGIALIVGIAAAKIVHDRESVFLRDVWTAEYQRRFNLLATSSIENIVSEDVPEIETAMKSLIEKDNAIYSLKIQNEQEKTLYSWKTPFRIQPEQLISLAREIQIENQTFGRLSISWNPSTVRTLARDHAISVAATIGAICMLLGLLLYLFLYFRAVHPIGSIVQRITAYLDGDLSPVSSLSSKASTEFKALDEAVDTLRDFILIREQVEAELEESTKFAESASRAKTDFLATMSHEIRTPMNGVLGMSQMLLRTDLDNRQRHFVERIKQSGNALLRVLNDILDISKIEAGRLELEEDNFILNHVIEDVTTLMELGAQQKELLFDITFEGDKSIALHGDAGRIRQILFNLAGNAVKFTETGGVTLRVLQTAVSQGMFEIRIEVTDTGIGIDDEVQERIFERFTQADTSTTRQFGGTGLGLAICREYVDLMHGSIGVRSVPGEGSTFWFEIRCRQGERPADDRVEPTGDFHGSARVAENRPLRILIAEDNPVNQEIAIATLEDAGHRVNAVATGIDAVEAVRSGSYDVVLMDIQMPEMDGIVATGKIRDLPGEVSNIPIIALTANAMVGDREKYLAAGMDDYASKPIRTDELFETIGRCLA